MRRRKLKIGKLKFGITPNFQFLFSSFNAVIFVVVLSFLFSSCEKNEDVAVTLPPPGNVTFDSVSMGATYDTMVFVDLSTGIKIAKPFRMYDLAFEASGDGQFIYLNTGKYMFAARTTFTDLTVADTAHAVWNTDSENLVGDSTAVGRNRNNNGSIINTVIFIDRGKYDFSGAERFRKMQIVNLNDYEYQIRYSRLDNSDYHDFTITKNNLYSLIYFSFSDGGKLVDVAPPKNNWDVVFTRYVHTFYDQPIPFRYYLVNGVLLNVWAGEQTAMLKKDSLPNYKMFDALVYNDVTNYTFTNEGGQIGFDWKYYDFNINKYVIRPDQYYLLKDIEGLYYKIKFIDFYNAEAKPGHPSYVYQRI